MTLVLVLVVANSSSSSPAWTVDGIRIFPTDALSEAVAEARNAMCEVGTAETLICLVRVVGAPSSSVTVSATLYVPWPGNVCAGLMPVPVVPSPKSQAYEGSCRRCRPSRRRRTCSSGTSSVVVYAAVGGTFGTDPAVTSTVVVAWPPRLSVTVSVAV